ncbi:MAG: TIGR03087 family PEP-CTERM/XrtA system glycosyltransferase [Proteobacteria bacterium]|nr:TIGR03087 family PEP-CTERM/XrtA system glycosyltransferase [Pseudomonadota bacterium]
MAKTKKILFLAHRIPYPPNKGDKIRTFNEIKHLSEFFSIELMALADKKSDLGFKTNLEPYCHRVHLFPLNPVCGKLRGMKSLLAGNSISEGYFFQADFYKKLSERLSTKTYHAVFCFSAPMAAYVFKFYSQQGKRLKKPILVMDFCDVDSEKWRQYSDRSSFLLRLLYRLEAERVAAFEKKTNQFFDASVFVSQEESRLFIQRSREAKKVHTIPNGVDHAYFSCDTMPLTPDPDPPSKIILFAGAMDYYANVEGVEWFCKSVFPLIRERVPEALFFIVGNNPHSRVRRLGNLKNVVVTGFVEDIRPYYEKARVCVVPLRIARGVQNKVLEAMSMEKPVVLTSAALCGIPACPGEHLFLADTSKSFAHNVQILLDDRELAVKTGISARKFIKNRFSWKLSMEKLKAILNNAS